MSRWRSRWSCRLLGRRPCTTRSSPAYSHTALPWNCWPPPIQSRTSSYIGSTDSAYSAAPRRQRALSWALSSSAGNQTVCRLQSHREPELTPPGHLLAVAWSNGTVKLLGAESNKIVHQICVSVEEAEVTCLAWASNLSVSKSLGNALSKAGDLWDGVAAEWKDADAQPLDLPRDLASIDIESSIPKLSVLPSGGTT